MMGGRIELESEVAQGSTFTLYFGNVNICSIGLSESLNPLDNLLSEKELSSRKLFQKTELLGKLSDEKITNFCDLQQNLTMSNVENFISCLSQLGNDHQCLFLLDYADILQQQLNNDDWQNIPETIDSFNTIQQSIQNYSS
jgi:hypothetical protein